MFVAPAADNLRDSSDRFREMQMLMANEWVAILQSSRHGEMKHWRIFFLLSSPSVFQSK